MKIEVELQQLKSNYDKTIDLVDGLKHRQKDVIKMIEFYSNSKYLNINLNNKYAENYNSENDVPYFQILNPICDTENTAKDLDTKDIAITSDDGNHYLESWLYSKEVQIWMKVVNFAKVLNDMRDTHTRYGSLLVKKVMRTDKDGKKQLYLELPEWKNTITDQVDIMSGAIVEVHWMTPIQVAKMTEWDKKGIDRLLKACKGTMKRIPVYEIRGEFSQATFKECNGDKYTPKDERKFSYQLYYIAGNPTDKTTASQLDGFIPLYWEDNTERVYKYLARKPKAGRSFGVGVMEEGEESQVWTNDAVLKQYRAMAYTSRVIGQTASKKLKGRNLLTEVEDGTILETEDGKPISALTLLPSGGLQQYTNIIQQWSAQLEKITSSYSAQRGDTPPSGTPFRLQATILQQSSSIFKTLQQEFGIFLTEIFEDWVIPYLSTQLTKEHILAYNFSPEELKSIDEKFSIRKANEIAKERVLSGGSITAEEYQTFIDNYDEFIKQTKGERFIEIPKDFYKNLKTKVTINITGEQRNKAVTLESLNNILITYASNPNLSADPVASQLLAKIIELSGAGISPVQITSAIAEKSKNDEQMQQMNMMQQGQGAPQQKMSLTNNPK